MLMSQAAISAAVTDAPSFGPSVGAGARCCAAASVAQPSANAAVIATPPGASPAATAAVALHVDIADLSRRAHVPALDRVVVIAIVRAARRHQRGAGRLHRAGLVDRAAREHARAPAPAPRQPEPH